MLYHYAAQIISRSTGKSAVAAAAYRAGENLWDERYGRRHDYSRKQGIAHSEILLPTGAAEWMGNRQELWNHVEAIEKHPRAQLCREFTVALQTELSIEQNLEMLRGFLQEQFVSRGLVIDLAVHYPMGEDDGNNEVCKNPHAHVMCVMRQVEDGKFGKKLRGTPTEHQAELLEERSAWADHVNAALAKAGVAGRVDHRTLAEQGINRLPQIHLGVHAHAMEQRGIRTERGEWLAAILEHNQQMDAITQTQQLSEAEENCSPTKGSSSARQDDCSPTKGGGADLGREYTAPGLAKPLQIQLPEEMPLPPRASESSSPVVAQDTQTELRRRQHRYRQMEQQVLAEAAKQGRANQLARPQIDFWIARLLLKEPNGDVGILAQSPESQRLKQTDGIEAAMSYVERLQQAARLHKTTAQQKPMER